MPDRCQLVFGVARLCGGECAGGLGVHEFCGGGSGDPL